VSVVTRKKIAALNIVPIEFRSNHSELYVFNAICTIGFATYAKRTVAVVVTFIKGGYLHLGLAYHSISNAALLVCKFHATYSPKDL
jgi:hypothetical protein